ncbi:Protein restricted tev movement 2 [Forsythia ovata]|uniref:Protein restricted tev movement 2 n=1 Tax=Forsythia ovata TaxID=205694 RepID=A0ABD1S798_9LAMI
MAGEDISRVYDFFFNFITVVTEFEKGNFSSFSFDPFIIVGFYVSVGESMDYGMSQATISFLLIWIPSFSAEAHSILVHVKYVEVFQRLANDQFCRQNRCIVITKLCQHLERNQIRWIPRWGCSKLLNELFQPASELIQEEDCDTLVLDLTGFKKEQLKAQLTRESRVLTISGARQLENNRWIGFHKDFPLSPNCDTKKISARFDGGMLFVNMPKLISPAEKEDIKLPHLETRKPQKPTEGPVNAPEKNQEQASQIFFGKC